MRTTRTTAVSFIKTDLAQGIAEQLRAGKHVLLLDVDINAPLFGEKVSIAEQVKAALGGRAELMANITNLDHHSGGSKSTATEEVFANLDKIRSLGGEVSVVIHHGDTDSILSSYVANNADRTYSQEERSLLIAAARAGDHSEGDFVAANDKLTPGVRLNFAIDMLCLTSRLELRRVYGTEDQKIEEGMQNMYSLIDWVLANARFVHSPDMSKLVEENPFRFSHRLVSEAAQGKNVFGISIDRSVEGLPIVTVNLSTPGYDDFHPISPFKTSLQPAIIILVRNGKMVGVGRNNDFADWLSLTDTEKVKGFYSRTDMRLKGGPHAGGANVARTPEGFATLPTPEEGLRLAQEFLKETAASRKPAPMLTAQTLQGPTTDQIKTRAEELIDNIAIFPKSFERAQRLGGLIHDLKEYASDPEQNKDIINEYYPGFTKGHFETLIGILQAELTRIEANH
jgi:hypothetical protein